jgi:hypothetical protein
VLDEAGGKPKTREKKIKKSDFDGWDLKEVDDVKSAMQRYHNEHKDGSGNFGYTIKDEEGNWYNLTGRYNSEGEITELRFGDYGGTGANITEFVNDVPDLLGEVDERITNIKKGGRETKPSKTTVEKSRTEQLKSKMDEWQKDQFEDAKNEGYEQAEAEIEAGTKVPPIDLTKYDEEDPIGLGYAKGFNEAISDHIGKWKEGELPDVMPTKEETEIRGDTKKFEVISDREAYEERAEKKRESWKNRIDEWKKREASGSGSSGSSTGKKRNSGKNKPKSKRSFSKR